MRPSVGNGRRVDSSHLNPALAWQIGQFMECFKACAKDWVGAPEVAIPCRASTTCGFICRRVKLWTMFYNTGARVSEVIGLRIKDVILDTSPSVHIMGKGRKQRSVPIWPSTVAIIRAWKRRMGAVNDDAHTFPNRDGSAMSRSNVTQRLALAVEIARKRFPQLKSRSISPHTIRHTTAMHLLQSGVDMSVIALWLGHESPTTTHMYLEADLAMKERALNRLRPLNTTRARYRPPDRLMQFLQSL
jgi:integrase/recombinase XerD